MILLETGHDAQVGLALGAVILGLPTKDPPVRVRRVPAVVAAESGAVARLGAVPKLVRHWRRQHAVSGQPATAGRT